MKHFILSIFISFLALSCSEDDYNIVGKTETFTVTSEVIKDDYPVYVYLPNDYDSSKKSKLIIGLDGDHRFEEIAEIISNKVQNNTMQNYVFVGIGNSGERNRDYTPTNYDKGKGGAAKFYQFLKEELIPKLEEKYNIDKANNKTLIGNSFGGLFTHYVTFQDRATNPFDKFISVGCSYWFDSGVIFEYEQEYASKNNDLPITFFTAMGTLEGGVNLASFDEMTQRLLNRNYANLDFEATNIKGHGHSGAANIGFKKGLDYVFKK